MTFSHGFPRDGLRPVPNSTTRHIREMESSCGPDSPRSPRTEAAEPGSDVPRTWTPNRSWHSRSYQSAPSPDSPVTVGAVRRILWNPRLDHHLVPPRQRVQVVVDLEVAGRVHVVHYRKAPQVVKVQAWVGPAYVAYRGNCVCAYGKRHLVHSGADLHPRLGSEHLFEHRRQGFAGGVQSRRSQRDYRLSSRAPGHSGPRPSGSSPGAA